MRNALPTTSSLSSRSYDYSSSLYSSRNSNSDSSSKLSERKSLLNSDYSSKNGGTSSYRSSLATNNISPSKSPNRDSTAEKKAQVEGLCGLWNIGNTCFMVSFKFDWENSKTSNENFLLEFCFTMLESHTRTHQDCAVRQGTILFDSQHQHEFINLKRYQSLDGIRQIDKSNVDNVHPKR